VVLLRTPPPARVVIGRPKASYNAGAGVLVTTSGGSVFPDSVRRLLWGEPRDKKGWGRPVAGAKTLGGAPNLPRSQPGWT